MRNKKAKKLRKMIDLDLFPDQLMLKSVGTLLTPRSVLFNPFTQELKRLKNGK